MTIEKLKTKQLDAKRTQILSVEKSPGPADYNPQIPEKHSR